MSESMELEEFNRCIVTHRDQLLSKARSVVHDEQAAEDITQEVLLWLWEVRAGLDGHPNPVALALTVVRNKAVDLLRRRRRESGTEAEEPSAADPGVETADEMALLRRIVDSLPPLQATVFRLKDIEGYGAEEIMAITGCTAANLRQCLSRARKKIREEYVRLTRVRL